MRTSWDMAVWMYCALSARTECDCNEPAIDLMTTVLQARTAFTSVRHRAMHLKRSFRRHIRLRRVCLKARIRYNPTALISHGITDETEAA
jgi:hypothetical protein